MTCDDGLAAQLAVAVESAPDVVKLRVWHGPSADLAGAEVRSAVARAPAGQMRVVSVPGGQCPSQKAMRDPSLVSRVEPSCGRSSVGAM